MGSARRCRAVAEEHRRSEFEVRMIFSSYEVQALYTTGIPILWFLSFHPSSLSANADPVVEKSRIQESMIEASEISVLSILETWETLKNRTKSTESYK